MVTCFQIGRVIKKYGKSNLKEVIFDLVNGDGKMYIEFDVNGKFTIFC